MTISAKVIADSISEKGIRITTFELEFNRFILPEFNTHRLFSRNAASSRAIPVKRAIELIKENTAMPIHWGKNQPGMSAKEECEEKVFVPFAKDDIDSEWHKMTQPREQAWGNVRDYAIEVAESFDKAGYHKQIVNRLLEPFSHIKVVCTATEYDNFFYLRCHPDAQPEIQELAEQMWKARESSVPIRLLEGEWHLPYFKDENFNGHWSPNLNMEQQKTTLEDAIAISASCCAQVSYRRLDDSLEKAKEIYERLVGMKPVHASPFEHQATPIPLVKNNKIPAGVTHYQINSGNHELNGVLTDAWSGNFRGWVQNRQLIDGHVCNKYKRN